MDETRIVGSATDAGRVDTGGYASLGAHVGSRLDENALLLAEAFPRFCRKMCCDECVTAFEGADTACLQISQVDQESYDREADRRDYS